jgi:hypothetical protein
MNAVSFSLHVHHGVCVDVYVLHIKGEALGFLFFRKQTSGESNHATRVAMSTLSWQTHGAMFVKYLSSVSLSNVPKLN